MCILSSNLCVSKGGGYNHINSLSVSGRSLLIKATLQFVSDLSQEFFSVHFVLSCLDPLRRESVYHSKDSSALCCCSHHDFDRIGSRTEYPAHLRTVFYLIQDVNGEGVFQENAENVSCADSLEILHTDG